MKIPHTIRMGGHKIPVTVRILEDNHGYFDTEKLEIHIDSASPKSMQTETFIHEVIEAACFFAEIPLPHPNIQALGLLMAQALGEDEDTPLSDAPGLMQLSR